VSDRPAPALPWALAESVATGLALVVFLVRIGSCLVGSLHPDDLAEPYRPEVGGRESALGVRAPRSWWKER
jgi:hypothetical protein